MRTDGDRNVPTGRDREDTWGAQGTLAPARRSASRSARPARRCRNLTATLAQHGSPPDGGTVASGSTDGTGSERVETVMQQPRSDQPSCLVAQPKRPDRPRVVVIDDDPDLATVYEELLGDEGYAVTVLASGLGAPARMREVRPSVIVLDLALPYRSGTSILHLLQDDPATAGVPVVVVSAIADLLPPQELRAAAAVVTKPFEPIAFLATLARVVGAAQPPGG